MVRFLPSTAICLSLLLSSTFPSANASFIGGQYPLSCNSKMTMSRRFSSSSNNNNNNNNNQQPEDPDDPENLITREMFHREQLRLDPDADPTVKRKGKKNKRYRILDNRDSMPFVVKVATPDPYKKTAEVRREAQRNTREHQKDLQKKGTPTLPIANKNKYVGMEHGIASTLYKKNSDGTTDKILGEIQLDKSTNCGDLIEVGERKYEVQKTTFQYKYAGGKRFVVVRKILQVKEVTRVAEENYIQRQFQIETLDKSDVTPNLE